ncbi:hypothetical protein DL93DRAFT_2082120 [Clavulina sp. PMI_390]|nr:hypothetical protein DL93DRAFT_2082120 [Clavulina sp. PMI_390]
MPQKPSVVRDNSIAFNAQAFQVGQNAIMYHNQAYAASNAGKVQEAIKLFQKAIEAKEAANMSKSSIAVSWNSLGETYLEDGQLDAALEALTTALNIRAALTPKKDHLFDTSVTRENIAHVYEAKNEPANAKKVRNEGVPVGEVCCSYNRCDKQTMQLTQLKTCARCKSPWYCGQACQLADWKSRHKGHCKKLAAASAEV